MSLLKIDASYWQYIFPAMLFLPSVDLLYAFATVQISRGVSRSQQATAGAVFAVTTRLATAISLSLISTFSSQVSVTYLKNNPLDSSSLPNTLESPEVLMSGYRVAGWICTGCLAIGVVLSLIFLRGIGIVGKAMEDEGEEREGEGEDAGDIRLTRRRVTRADSTG